MCLLVFVGRREHFHATARCLSTLLSPAAAVASPSLSPLFLPSCPSQEFLRIYGFHWRRMWRTCLASPKKPSPLRLPTRNGKILFLVRTHLVSWPLRTSGEISSHRRKATPSGSSTASWAGFAFVEMLVKQQVSCLNGVWPIGPSLFSQSLPLDLQWKGSRTTLLPPTWIWNSLKMQPSGTRHTKEVSMCKATWHERKGTQCQVLGWELHLGRLGFSLSRAAGSKIFANHSRPFEEGLCLDENRWILSCPALPPDTRASWYPMEKTTCMHASIPISSPYLFCSPTPVSNFWFPLIA